MRTFIFTNGTGGTHVIKAESEDAAWKQLGRLVHDIRLHEWSLSSSQG